MKKEFIACLATGLLMFSVAGISNAGLLQIVEDDNSFAASLPLNPYTHDVAETAGASGFYAANLIATEDITLKYEFLGFEAGWTNSFYVDGELGFVNKNFGSYLASTEGDQVSSSASAADFLDFAFMVLAGGNTGYGVENGSNVMPYGVPTPDTNNPYSMPNFFLGYADDAHNSVYIALDDGGGVYWDENGLADDNHDDLVIKVTATAAPVPEPATMLLFGTGLVGLAGSRLRKKEK